MINYAEVVLLYQTSRELWIWQTSRMGSSEQLDQNGRIRYVNYYYFELNYCNLWTSSCLCFVVNFTEL